MEQGRRLAILRDQLVHPAAQHIKRISHFEFGISILFCQSKLIVKTAREIEFFPRINLRHILLRRRADVIILEKSEG